MKLISTAQRQQGAALAISLILLLAMTIIGVAAMSGARQEISMAALMQEEERALRRSERTLRVAEDAVQDIADIEGRFEFGNAKDAYYLPEDNFDPMATDWTRDPTLDGPEASSNDRDDDDAYVVEYLGEVVIPGNSPGDDGSEMVAGGTAHVYRITTRSATGGKAVRIVESIFTTIEAP